MHHIRTTATDKYEANSNVSKYKKYAKNSSFPECSNVSRSDITHSLNEEEKEASHTERRKAMAGKVKSFATRDKEHRCQGYGKDYVPYIKIQEARSSGVASMIYDPIEGRSIHVLSETERLTYDEIRWDEQTLHIREQYLLDTSRVRKAQQLLGLPQTGDHFTTDLLVDRKDGTKKAYFIKRSAADFNPKSIEYEGRQPAYMRLINRYKVEKLYWMMEGTDCQIRTVEMCNRILAANVELVMHFYDPANVYNVEQMALCLIAHRLLPVPMETEMIAPARFRYEKDGIEEKFDALTRLLGSQKERELYG